MTQYKFIGTVKDINTLHELGYRDNAIDTNRPIEITEDGEFDAAKTFDKKKVCVSVNNVDPIYGFPTIEVYRYKGKPDNHNEIAKVTKKLWFIQELIDAGLVVIDKKKGSE